MVAKKPAYRVLIVEDDITIAREVARELEGWGYGVERIRDFSAVMKVFRAFAPQLVLLDLSLPYRSGFHWCGEIRRESKVPVLFISSAADSMNMVTALHQGADDYVAKPFDLPVLVAKVQALLRRSYDFAGRPDMLCGRGIVLNQDSMCLVFGQKKAELTRNEFRILQLLMESAGKVVTREAIMRRLWEHESFIDDNTLAVNMARLRKKLGAVGLDDFIATKRGEGYIISCGE